MAGIEVTRAVMDVRLGEAGLSVRGAFDKVEHIFDFLQNNPNGATDPLVDTYGYTTDEAYLIRVTFENLMALKNNNSSVFANLSKLTGLE